MKKLEIVFETGTPRDHRDRLDHQKFSQFDLCTQLNFINQG